MADRSVRVYTARGPADGEDWEAVSVALNERMATRRVGQQELADLSGVSVSTIRQVQHCAGRWVQNKTLAALSLALGWPDSHLADVLREDPVPADRPSSERTGDDVAETLHRVESEIERVHDRLAALEQLVERALRQR